MVDPYTPTHPYDHGFLDTGDGNCIYYEQLGNPEGKPAVNVHGGPEPERNGDLLTAYARLMENPDRAIRAQAAANWLAWEDAVICDEPNGVPGMYSDQEVAAQIAFVRICAHFFSNGAWLEEDQLLRNAGKLAGIPAVLVHGRHDMGCPIQTVWELAKAWPDARLHIIEDSGHAGSDAMHQATRTAIEDFKNR
jgi:proline iminopeptidase